MKALADAPHANGSSAAKLAAFLTLDFCHMRSQLRFPF